MWFWAGDGSVNCLNEWKNLRVFVHRTAMHFRSIGFLKFYSKHKLIGHNCNVKD